MHIGQRLTPSKTVLGQMIRNRRLELKLSQMNLATLVGTTRSQISATETGAIPMSSGHQVLSRLKKYADALQLDIDELLQCRPPRKRKENVHRVPSSLGTRIYERRKELRLTQTKVAEMTGIAASTISNVETGSNPKQETKNALNRFLATTKTKRKTRR